MSFGIGGVVVFDYLSYLRINGHPNDYFGWGGEDICVKNRIDITKLSLDRSNYNNSDCIQELDHVRDSSNNAENISKSKKDIPKENGVIQTNYKVQERLVTENCVIYKVHF